jgi:hypothetical protein
MHAERFGVPPDMIAQARDNPAILDFLRQKLEGLHLAEPETDTVMFNDADDVTRRLDAAKAAFERDRNRPVRKAPKGNRHEYVFGANASREANLKQKNHAQILMSFTGVPKSFSSKPLKDLRRSEFPPLLFLRRSSPARYPQSTSTTCTFRNGMKAASSSQGSLRYQVRRLPSFLFSPFFTRTD